MKDTKHDKDTKFLAMAVNKAHRRYHDLRAICWDLKPLLLQGRSIKALSREERKQFKIDLISAVDRVCSGSAIVFNYYKESKA